MKTLKSHCFAELVPVIMIISAKRYLALIIISPFFFRNWGRPFSGLCSRSADGGNANDVFDFVRNARSNELHLDSADTRAQFFFASSRDRWFASSRSTFNNREPRSKIIRCLRSGRSALPLDSSASAMMKYHIIEAVLLPRSLMNFRWRCRNLWD